MAPERGARTMEMKVAYSRFKNQVRQLTAQERRQLAARRMRAELDEALIALRVHVTGVPLSANPWTRSDEIDALARMEVR